MATPEEFIDFSDRIEQAIMDLDPEAMQALADDPQMVVIADATPRWLHDACSRVARWALRQGQAKQAAPIFEALERLAPGQAKRIRGTTTKLNGDLTREIVSLNDPGTDAWLARKKIALNREGAFALLDRWLDRERAGTLDLDADIPFTVQEKPGLVLAGALIGIGILRGDTPEQIQGRMASEAETGFTLGARISTGLVRVARRIIEYRGLDEWARWQPKTETLAWVSQHCTRKSLEQACELLIRVPQEVMDEALSGFLDRIEQAPFEWERERMEARTATASGKGGQMRL